MQLRMELELRQNEISLDHERSFEQKNQKQELAKLQLQEKKNVEEIQWLKSQLIDQKARLKTANEEYDLLQDKLLELKSNYMNRASQGVGGTTPASQGLQEFERGKMQQAIDELGERCRTLRDDKKKLDAENNFFHMSTTIFIKLKPVMETEKQLCYQLAQLNLDKCDESYESKREKIEKGISKCRDTIIMMEVKLKKILDRVQKDQTSSRHKRQANKVNLSSIEETKEALSMSKLTLDTSEAGLSPDRKKMANMELPGSFLDQSFERKGDQLVRVPS